MKKFKIYIADLMALMVILEFCIFLPVNAYSYCSYGVAVPPFLAQSVPPNLLLIIDNSASMYDLAYIDDTKECYDDSYNNGSEYAGYFESLEWYAYDFGSDKFVLEPNGNTLKDSATYRNSYLYISVDATPSVTAFGATGNLLNWASASKFDIEKKILTGGKYDASHNVLVLESRGCLGRRYVKKIGVTDSSSNPAYVTLGIRSPNETEKGADYILTGSTNTTRIELFNVTTNGFAYDSCQAALNELNSDNPNLGQLKADVKDCMGYTGGSTSESFAAFNHALQECWYYNKHGDWQPGAGTVNSMKNACENVYDYKPTSGTYAMPPETITTDNKAYVCFGVYGTDPPYGYVGRCWEPSSTGEERVCTDRVCTDEPTSGANPRCNVGFVEECSGNYNSKQDTCNKAWVRVQDCTGGGSLEEGDWTDDIADYNGDGIATDDSDICVDQALKDYCGILEIPEVIDPSDAQGSTGTIWNAPAVLIDSGVVSQLEEPLAVLRGHIAQTTVPEGLLQKNIDKIRIGAMVFNDNGSKSECPESPDSDDPIAYNCSDTNKDGSKIITYIDQNSEGSTDHIDALVSAVNDIEANSWTPLAEAMYNAIGYYTQNSDRRLHVDDFIIDSSHDPIEYYCQNNNVLIITDGASTADQSSDVETFIGQEGHKDEDIDDSKCGDLYGSTWLDDLTYYAFNGTDLYSEQLDGQDKETIKTYIVVAGTPRDTGATECSPDVIMPDAATNGDTDLYTAASIDELENQLELVFSEIGSRVASGSAASVISASRGGEGALYQAIFWPSVEGSDPDTTVKWTGEVHALLIDDYGFMYEDTNQDGGLDGGDQRVSIYYNEDSGMSEACYGTVSSDSVCVGETKPLEDVYYLWSVSQRLNSISDEDILVNRDPYLSDDGKRYIFTWNDLNNDGVVASQEILPFTGEFSADTATPSVVSHDGTVLSIDSSRGPINLDFGVETTDEVNKIVKWIRGSKDQDGMRYRQVQIDFDHDAVPEIVTWRLGDVVYSTPMAVSWPSESYHTIYRDTSYANFVQQYKKRRQMIYFGANDGMLHAVNGGFYSESSKKFCRTQDCSSESGPLLGTEMWAYVPYNLLPHLKCLTNPNYTHKYYVDLRPRMFDVQIFPDNATHPGGWGTILVGGMRFGGAKVRADEIDLNGDGAPDYPNDNRLFTSAYFILDITDPENPPVLLGELTNTTTGSFVNFGYTTAISTMVPMKTGDTTTWYLILGTGPTDVEGKSTQTARLCVLPLSWLTSGTPLRIPAALPDANQGGSFALSSNSFISDIITMEFDFVPEYKADVIYFGTVEGTWGNWGGQLYRLVTRNTTTDPTTGDIIQVETTPQQWSNLLSGSSLTNPLALIDVGQPITGAPAVGWDGYDYWVYFGTGRYYHVDDKLDTSQQTFYGIKEPKARNADRTIPLDSNYNPILTWKTVSKTGTPNTIPGNQGLLRVDQIQVNQAAIKEDATLSCSGGGCLPYGVTNYQELINYISGDYSIDPPSTGTDGWYKNFAGERERNLGQGTLLGGILTFTTFQPFTDVCKPEGSGFLYGVYYQTGTAWHETVFSDVDDDSSGDSEGGIVADNVYLGRGMSTTPNLHVGKQEGTTAFAQTSTGAIIEIPQPNMAEKNTKTGRLSWQEFITSD